MVIATDLLEEAIRLTVAVGDNIGVKVAQRGTIRLEQASPLFFNDGGKTCVLFVSGNIFDVEKLAMRLGLDPKAVGLGKAVDGLAFKTLQPDGSEQEWLATSMPILRNPPKRFAAILHELTFAAIGRTGIEGFEAEDYNIYRLIQR